ncbi:MAG TPA: DUF2868 domain-containing protein [Burkholderiales bacterium]|nr:DUF2868 domain-containing protein [Burkholderiales bacterium]
MNEAAARNVVLVRAFETAGAGRSNWTESDALWASRAAAEVVGEEADADRFVARRGQLAAERLRERDRSVARALRAVTWRPWIGWVFVLSAFGLGFATDYIGPAQRVNVLAFPLLALIAWNLVAYAIVAVRTVARIASSRTRPLGPLSGVVARLARGVNEAAAALAPDTPLAPFVRDWARVSAALTAARVARILHLSALAFALGAIVALYLRGLVLEYRAGWESTFLGPAEVHSLLTLVLGPASRLTGIPIADPQHLEALQFAAGPGENAAHWLNLYATTIALFVLIPRALLALGAWFAQRRLSQRLPLPLDDAYFQRMLRNFKGERAAIRVLPYSYQLTPQSALVLKEIVARVFGPKAEVSIAPVVAFGDEDALPADLLPTAPLALAAPLFSLSATPEAENHGAFIAALAAVLTPGSQLVALIDETGFRQRFAGQTERLEERRGAWRQLLAAREAAPVFVDLAATDPTPAADALTAALDQIARAEAVR